MFEGDEGKVLRPAHASRRPFGPVSARDFSKPHEPPPRRGRRVGANVKDPTFIVRPAGRAGAGRPWCSGCLVPASPEYSSRESRVRRRRSGRRRHRAGSRVRPSCPARQNAGQEVGGVAGLDRRAQPVSDDGADGKGPDRAGDAEGDLDAFGDPAGDGGEEGLGGQKVAGAQDIERDDAVLDPVGPDDDAAAVRAPVVGQFDHAPQAEPDAAGLGPHGVDRTAGAVDAIAAQFARRLGQLGQVQRNGAAAFDAAAAGPAGQQRQAQWTVRSSAAMRRSMSAATCSWRRFSEAMSMGVPSS